MKRVCAPWRIATAVVRKHVEFSFGAEMQASSFPFSFMRVVPPFGSLLIWNRVGGIVLSGFGGVALFADFIVAFPASTSPISADS